MSAKMGKEWESGAVRIIFSVDFDSSCLVTSDGRRIPPPQENAYGR